MIQNIQLVIFHTFFFSTYSFTVVLMPLSDNQCKYSWKWKKTHSFRSTRPNFTLVMYLGYRVYCFIAQLCRPMKQNLHSPTCGFTVSKAVWGAVRGPRRHALLAIWRLPAGPPGQDLPEDRPLDSTLQRHHANSVTLLQQRFLRCVSLLSYWVLSD